MNILPTYLCAAALLLFAAPLAAQQPAPAPSAAPFVLPDPMKVAPELNDKFDGNYLMPLLILRPLRASYTASPKWRNYYFQALSWDESFVGNYAEAMADNDNTGPPDTADLKAIADARIKLRAYTAVDARQAILEMAAPRQAVFINEAHYLPMNRAFTLSLLRGLYAKGFRYFAAEALDEKDTNLQKRGYPTTSSGTYTSEPVFGDLVRTAIKIGYKIIAYEHFGPKTNDPIADANERERGEAQNLYDHIFKDDPKAKVLVHAGYGHIAKATMTLNLTPGSITSQTASGTLTLMALWFERISKIVPLSIDQTNMTEASLPQNEYPLYQAAIADNLLQDKPVALKDQAGHYLASVTNSNAYDLYVFHPQDVYEFGRPTWLSEEGQRQAYILPGDLGIPVNTPALVQAFYANEDAKIAVPIDQIEVKPGLNPLPALMLPAGRFRLRVVDGPGRVLREWLVTRDGATP